MTTLPLYTPIAFGLTVLLTLYLLLNTLKQTSSPARVRRIGVLLILWMLLHTGLSLTGFYQTQSTPPRLIFLIWPALLVIGFLLGWSKSRAYLQTLSLERLTWIHVVRIPVELVLFWLFLYRQIPVEMTFEGRNFDILAGLTAPFVASGLEPALRRAVAQHHRHSSLISPDAFPAVWLHATQCSVGPFPICVAAWLHRAGGFVESSDRYLSTYLGTPDQEGTYDLIE